MTNQRIEELKDCLLIMNGIGGRHPEEKQETTRIRNFLKQLQHQDTPEDCRLVAVYDGTAWGLYVEDQQENVLAILRWPETFGESQTTESLISHGFEIG